MTVIKGYLSMARWKAFGQRPRNMVQIALIQTDRLGRLVTDRLDVSPH